MQVGVGATILFALSLLATPSAHAQKFEIRNQFRILPGGTQLFVKSKCGPSRAAQLAVDNLHLGNAIEILNVSNNAAAATALTSAAGNDQAPCLVLDGKAIQEAADITQTLADQVAPLA